MRMHDLSFDTPAMTHPPCCSELQARCCVQPASELMGLALREVLPLAWQQEWRREQGEPSDGRAECSGHWPAALIYSI